MNSPGNRSAALRRKRRRRRARPRRTTRGQGRLTERIDSSASWRFPLVWPRIPRRSSGKPNPTRGGRQGWLSGPEPQPPDAPPVQEGAQDANAWDKIRALTHSEKLILAGKADRSERVILAQDGDPQVLYFLLKNPRITQDEVARLARSAYLSFQ